VDFCIGCYGHRLLIADDESFGAVQKAMSMFENGFES
jgi:hypothetical protein